MTHPLFQKQSTAIRNGHTMKLLPLVLLLALPAVVQGQFTYITNNGAITITGYTGSGGDITIPDTVNGLPVTSIAGHVFSGFDSLTSITFGTNLTSMGNSAFADCTGLQNLTIPDNVTSIGTSGAFRECSGLTNVTLGNGLTNLADNAFYNCNGLRRVTIGNSVTTIGYKSFYYCFNLTSLVIPASVTTIRDYAFQYCTGLGYMFFQGNAPSIGSSAFLYDNSVTAYYLAGTAGWGTTLAGRPTRLWDPQVPFLYTTNGGTITITGDIPGYTNWDSFAVMSIPAIINGLPVTSIGTAAFQFSSTLASVTIPNSVTNIAFWAFRSCSSLTNVTIGNSVISIGDSAFAFCTNLTGVYCRGNAPTANPTVFASDGRATVYHLPGTTGWGPTFANRPTAPWLPRLQSGGSHFGVETNQFGFDISWASGMAAVVEACTDLAGAVWAPLQTNTLSGDSLYFSDPDWTNYPARFYRIRSP